MDVQETGRPARGCTVVEVCGELDMATSPGLRDGLQRLIDVGDRQVVDLAAAGFLDSSAIGALVVVFRALSQPGGRLSLAAVQPGMRSVLRITSVDQVFDIHDSVRAAEADIASPEG